MRAALQYDAVNLGDLANLVTIGGAAAAAVAGYSKWRKPWRKRPGADGYAVTDIRAAMRWYVAPDVVDHDPSLHDEPADGVHSASRVPLMATLDELLAPRSPVRYVLLLGDSGTGKTAAIINYYVRCVRRFLPRRVAMAHLGEERIVEWVRAREGKGDTLLLLDALDELLRPGDDAVAKLQELARETEAFGKVVISCRTQYFERDEAVPAFADVWRRGPRAAGEAPRQAIRRLYLAPLSDEQLERYLRKRFPFGHRRHRAQARNVIRAAPRLSVRPMLLAFLDDLSPNPSHPSSLPEIYEQGVTGWLRRECATKKEADDLRRFSDAVALEIWSQRESAVLPARAEQIARSLGVDVDARTLSGRSLLNRDAEGRWKFAHRSIMEYLVVKQFFAGNVEDASGWTDQMQQFAEEIMRGRWALAGYMIGSNVALALACGRTLRRAREPRPFMLAAASAIASSFEDVTFYRTRRVSPSEFGETDIVSASGADAFVRYRHDSPDQLIERELIDEVNQRRYLNVPVEEHDGYVYALALIVPYDATIDRDALAALSERRARVSP